jgi:Na+-transporting NADH:ubiquinone oxidoreductase subunit D
MGVNVFDTPWWNFYELGYKNNGMMILPPAALILVGVIIWVQRSRHKELVEEN